ncbi:MAG TPA: Chromate resistance protein ChrB, partial [bacterium]
MPPTPSRNRVGIWRKLRRMGAVSLKGAAWMLPENPDTVELMHWLMQEVQTLKGDAALLRSDTVEMLPERDPAVLFHEARTQDYAAVEQQCETLLAELSHPLAGRRGAAGG